MYLCFQDLSTYPGSPLLIYQFYKIFQKWLETLTQESINFKKNNKLFNQDNSIPIVIP